MTDETRKITIDKENLETKIREYGDKANSWATKGWISLAHLIAFTIGRYYDIAGQDITNPDYFSYGFWATAGITGVTALIQYTKNAGLRDNYKEMLKGKFSDDR